MVEFAIGVVVLFSIAFFTIAIGQAVWRYNTVSAMAKRGARYAAVHGSASGSVADSAAVQAYVETQASGVPLVVHTSWPDAGSKAPGKRVQVRVESAFVPPVRGIVSSGIIELESTARDLIVR